MNGKTTTHYLYVELSDIILQKYNANPFPTLFEFCSNAISKNELHDLHPPLLQKRATNAKKSLKQKKYYKTVYVENLGHQIIKNVTVRFGNVNIGYEDWHDIWSSLTAL